MTTIAFPREFRVPASQEHIRSIKSPYTEDLTIIHAFVKVRDLPTDGKIPDKINPRSHEKIKSTGRVPLAIKESMELRPKLFHLLNRGCLILAKKAWYDNQSKILHFIIESEHDHGMVDGATTDRVLDQLKKELSQADFSSLSEDEITEPFKDAYIHLEIIAGNIDSELRLQLADARNTSEQVKEFSLEDLGGKFNWLKEVLETSELRGKVRYRENEPKLVDVRTILALLSLFHPKWLEKEKDPIVAYTGKGAVLEYYKDAEWESGYKKLAPVVVDILKLYDYVHAEFQKQYMKYQGQHAKLGRRTEVKYLEGPKEKELPLTGRKTKYVLPDGWLYPLLASMRVLLVWPKNGKGEVQWSNSPFAYFDEHGAELVGDIIEQSEELGHNPNAVGKSKRLWSGLRMTIENKLLKSQQTGDLLVEANV